MVNKARTTRQSDVARAIYREREEARRERVEDRRRARAEKTFIRGAK